MKKPPKMSKADRQVQEASDAATWDAIEAYRDTGEMVPAERDGKLVFLTVDEALRSRDDYERRRRESGDWRLKNLLAQFAAEGQSVTPDVWDRLEADRRQALEDDLAWIARGRAAAGEDKRKGANCFDKRDMRGERDRSGERLKETVRGQEASSLSCPSRLSCQKGK